VVREAENTRKMFEEFKVKHEDTKKELRDPIEDRQEQFEKYMKDILEARLNLASPFLVYSREHDPVVKEVKEYAREKEEKIKRSLGKNNVPIK
jgi:hypothetical protein